MTLNTLNYQQPSTIEGDTNEVERAVLAQLRDLTSELQDLIESSNVQLRSSWMSAYLREHPTATADELREAWEESPRASQCVRLAGAQATVHKLANSM